MPDRHQATGLIEDVRDELRRIENPTLGDLVDALDEGGYGPAFAIIPLVELTPLGGIPGVPTLLATVIGLLAIRLLIGKEHFWLPDRLRGYAISNDRVNQVVNLLCPVTRRIDGVLQERLAPLASDAAMRVAALVILVLCLPVPALELIPFATSIPMIAIAVFGFAMLFRDGVLMAIGFTAAAAAAFGGVYSFVLT